MSRVVMQRIRESLEAHDCGPIRMNRARCPLCKAENALEVSQRVAGIAIGCERGCARDGIVIQLGLGDVADQIIDPPAETIEEPPIPGPEGEELHGNEVRPDLPDLHRVPIATWPKALGDDAYHGPAGAFVKAVAPHSEADPAALLFQFLTAVGNVIGRGRWFRVEATTHHARLFVALVGETAIARKGTSWDHVRASLAAVAPTWADRIATGLSSGEGLIAHVRDPIGDSPGVEDKRILIVESELASTLRVMGREGNNLSPVLRRAWDGDILSTLTRKDPLKATHAHASIIGHITHAELTKSLGTVECFNGFANRWLWVCARRSKMLPEGGRLEDAALADVRRDLRLAVDDAQEPGELMRDDGATRRLWFEVYERLTSPPPGVLGSVLSRGAAHVMRMALIYAVLDRSAWIREEHLRAALECWRYCEDSAAFLFGERTGNLLADKVLRMLSERGELARYQIVDALGRHVEREKLDDARDQLLDLALIRTHTVYTKGRPLERWSLLAAPGSGADPEAR